MSSITVDARKSWGEIVEVGKQCCSLNIIIVVLQCHLHVGSAISADRESSQTLERCQAVCCDHRALSCLRHWAMDAAVQYIIRMLLMSFLTTGRIHNIPPQLPFLCCRSHIATSFCTSALKMSSCRKPSLS